MILVGGKMPNKDSESKITNSSESSAFNIRANRFPKKYLAVLVLPLIAVIAVGFLIPQGTAIPLNTDYTIGEKMVYTTTRNTTLMSYDTSSGQPLSPQIAKDTRIILQEAVTVMDVDENCYYLNHTIMSGNGENTIVNVSIVDKISKSGYSAYFIDADMEDPLPNNRISQNPFISQVLNKPEAKVGDTVVVPYPAMDSSVVTTGELTITFSGIEEITVPAGTYRVIKVDMTSQNVRMVVENSPVNASKTVDVVYEVYLEYGTLRQVRSNIQETSYFQSSLINATYRTTNDMVLYEHSKP